MSKQPEALQKAKIAEQKEVKEVVKEEQAEMTEEDRRREAIR